MRTILRTVALASMALTGAATCGHAADLGASHNGGYKDDGSTIMPGASWSGVYIEGGLGHAATEHDVKGHTDETSAKFLKEADYLTKDVYAVKVPAGTVHHEAVIVHHDAVTVHHEAVTVHHDATETTPAYDEVVTPAHDEVVTPASDEVVAPAHDEVVTPARTEYTTDKTTSGATLWKPAGSVVTAEDKTTIGATLVDTTVASTTKADGSLYALPTGKTGDDLLANGGDAVGYTLDTSSMFSSDGTGKGVTGYVGLGYDRQFSSFLIGVKGDYQFRSAKTTIDGIDVEQSDAFFLGSRLGVIASDRFMVYGLVGYTWLNHANFADNLRAADHSHSGTEAVYGDGSFGGVTFGGGVETRITPNLYVGLEARFTQYGKETIYTSNYADADNHSKSSTVVTDEPSERYIGVNLKYKLPY